MAGSETVFLFPNEKLLDVITFKGVRFEVIERSESIWCGTLGYATDPVSEPDIEALLKRYQSLVSVQKRGLVTPEWSGCISIDYWPGGLAPRGIMFMQQVSTAEQDQQYDVFTTPASLYIRVCCDSADIPQKLLGKEACGIFELFGPIHEVAAQNGYTPWPLRETEIEYYGSACSYAYCAVVKGEPLC